MLFYKKDELKGIKMVQSFKRFFAWYKQPRSKMGELVELAGILLIVFIIRTIGFGLYAVPTGSMETTMLSGERFFADKFTPLFMPLKHGDIITLDDPTYKYANNQLLNWWQHYVWGPSNWTKRVIGVPGDHIEGKIENGKPEVYRNGQKLDEPYINKYPLIMTYNPGKPEQPALRSYVPDLPFDQQPFYQLNNAEVINAKQLFEQSIRYPHTPVRAKSGSNEQSADIFDVHLGADEYWAMGDNRQGSLDSRFWGPLKHKFIHGKVKFCLYSIDIEPTWGKFEILHIFPFDIILHPIDFWSHVRWSRCFRFVH